MEVRERGRRGLGKEEGGRKGKGGGGEERGEEGNREGGKKVCSYSAL